MEKTIVILIGFMPIPRIYKRIDVEKQLGNLHVVCWDKGQNMLFPPKEDGYKVHTISVPAKADPIYRLLPYNTFSQKATKILEEIEPDLIHLQGLDMLKIAAAYKKRAGKKVSIIYEVADLHRLIVDEQHNLIKKVAQNYLKREDKRLSTTYDMLLLTSKKYNEVYFQHFVEQEKIVVIPNVPKMSAFKNYKKKADAGQFTVGFIGSIRYKQQIKNLIQAADICGVKLLFAGYEEEPDEIEVICKDKPNINWIGRFDFEEKAACLYGKCDAIYSVYDADKCNVRVALPNKLYEAVYCELPLIVAQNTYLSQIVEEWGVGVAVDHHRVDQLCQVILRLRDDSSYRDQIAENCKKRKTEVSLERYNNKLEERIQRLLYQ